MLLAAAIFALGACASPAPAADERTCAVYRAFYAQMKNEDVSALAPLATPFSQSTARPRDMRAMFMDMGEEAESVGAPLKFSRFTGEVEEREFLGEMREWRVRAPLEMDTSGYFAALSEGGRQSVRDCFFAVQEKPEFFSRSAPEFALLTWLRGGEAAGAGVWRLSPAGFSADGRHALIYAEYACWGSCSIGAFYLFEHRDGRWEYVGDSVVWIA